MITCLTTPRHPLHSLLYISIPWKTFKYARRRSSSCFPCVCILFRAFSSISSQVWNKKHLEILWYTVTDGIGEYVLSWIGRLRAAPGLFGERCDQIRQPAACSSLATSRPREYLCLQVQCCYDQCVDDEVRKRSDGCLPFRSGSSDHGRRPAVNVDAST
jgi:hypothetical protein